MKNKKFYLAPKINIVKLDNEIALALASNPPLGPGETFLAPEFSKNDPYKSPLS